MNLSSQPDIFHFHCHGLELCVTQPVVFHKGPYLDQCIIDPYKRFIRSSIQSTKRSTLQLQMFWCLQHQNICSFKADICNFPNYKTKYS